MDVDVAIVGYGPVGAMTAISLARAGRSVRILERGFEPATLPRAVGIDGESLRAFQRLGLGDTIEAICQPPRDPNTLAFTNSKREPLIQLDVAVRGPNGWPDLLLYRQGEFKFVEVKSSNDKLSEEQKSWIGDNHDILKLPFAIAKIHKIT